MAHAVIIRTDGTIERVEVRTGQQVVLAAEEALGGKVGFVRFNPRWTAFCDSRRMASSPKNDVATSLIGVDSYGDVVVVGSHVVGSHMLTRDVPQTFAT